MEKFQVYNRELNTWEDENISQISGWSENFVLDKTTDTAKIKLKYKGVEFPNWNNGDWCRILHLADGETGATYQEIKKQGKKILSESYLSYRLGEVTGVDEVRRPRINIYCNYTGNVVGSYKVEINYTRKRNVASDEETITDVAYSDFQTPSFRVVIDHNLDVVYSSFTLNYVKFTEITPEFIREETSYYIPKNHEQYILSNPIMVKDTINDEIDIQLDLLEPIEISRGILCETMSFTNQIEKTVDGVKYTHKPLNHYSVLEKILKVTPANNDNYEEGYNPKENKSWFNRIKICDCGLLEEIAFNDETYSEPSLYDILLNKYDSSVGRTPVFYFDINNETDLPYNNERTEYILEFIRQDGYDKESITLESLTENAKEIIVSKNDDNYTDGIVSNYDNLAPNNKTYYSAQNLWVVPEVDTNERGLTEYGKGYWVLRLPHSIKKVLSVKSVYTDNLLVTSKDFKVFEEKEYVANNTYYKNDEAVWYKEGENIIHLNGMYYKEAEGINGKINVFNVEYEPLISGRFDLAQDYQTQINQIDSQIDNEKFGEYLKDYFASMNKADLTIQKTYENFNDIQEIGTRVLGENKNYIITNVSIQNRGFDYDALYQLNENHIRKSDNIQAPQEIRKNIEIGIDATKERKSMFVDIYNISLKRVETENIFNFNKSVVFSSLLNNYNSNNYPQLAYLLLKSKYPFVSDGNLRNEFSLLCEIGRYYLNSTICFNVKYFDNAEAGKSKILSSYEDLTHTKYGSPEQQIPVLYTDIFGEFDTFDINFIISDNDNVYNYIYEQGGYPELDQEQIKSYQSLANKSATYPLTTAIDSEFLQSPIASVEGINYYKDMLDTFNYTIGVNYKSDNNIILCSAFFKNNILLENVNSEIKKVICYNSNIKESDYKITQPSEQTIISNVTYNNGEITINLENSVSAKALAIVDENDNPVLIINDYDKDNFNQITLYC